MCCVDRYVYIHIYSIYREGKVSVHLVRNGLQWIRDYPGRERERGMGTPLVVNWHVFEVW